MEHYVEHLTGITRGTRDDCLRMYRRTFASLQLGNGRVMGNSPVDAPNRDHIAKAINILSERPSPKSIANAHRLLSSALLLFQTKQGNESCTPPYLAREGLASSTVASRERPNHPNSPN